MYRKLKTLFTALGVPEDQHAQLATDYCDHFSYHEEIDSDPEDPNEQPTAIPNPEGPEEYAYRMAQKVGVTDVNGIRRRAEIDATKADIATVDLAVD